MDRSLESVNDLYGHLAKVEPSQHRKHRPHRFPERFQSDSGRAQIESRVIRESLQALIVPLAQDILPVVKPAKDLIGQWVPNRA